ncbi:MAG: M20 aminoacylase family protein [Elusimicrobiota bacterium]|nr:M20 aminoacylase family protein [Elusimicrobiota bacterium]
MTILEQTRLLQEEMTGWRRAIHACPETAFEELRTAAFVAEKLESFGLRVNKGLSRTGVVGTLSSGSGRRAIGLRADMDALCVQEQNTFEYRSRNEGKMHACGHDGHTAMLLGAAKYLAGNGKFDGTIHFIFQPAEESGGGGREMVEQGLFEKFPCDSVYGMHNWPGLPVGQFGVRPGPAMASCDDFEIELAGHGCHAAMPHTGIDLIVAASALVQALQTICSRNVDPLEPAVVSVTQLHAGDTYNVIPGTAILRGTARAFKPEVQDLLERRLGEISTATAAAYGARAKVRYQRNYPPTVNAERETVICAAVLERLLGAENVIKVPQVMGAEDFSFMLNAKPGCYVFAGNGPVKDGAALHNPRYDFNDEVLCLGAAYWASLTEHLLAPDIPFQKES